MANEIETPVPGDRVAAAAAHYAFGPSFLVGSGTVLDNRDVMSRERGELKIHFDSGVVGGSQLPTIAGDRTGRGLAARHRLCAPGRCAIPSLRALGERHREVRHWLASLLLWSLGGLLARL